MSVDHAARMHCQVVRQLDGPTWCASWPAAGQLQGRRIRPGHGAHWRISNHQQHAVQVVVMGQSGRGKSSLLNQLAAGHYFAVDDVCACTQTMQSVDISLTPDASHILSFVDLPGVGESLIADARHLSLYEQVLPLADVLVYVCAASQRDTSVDQQVWRRLNRTQPAWRQRTLGVLTQADRLTGGPEGTLVQKMHWMCDQSGLPLAQILAVDNESGTGIANAAHHILQRISEHLLP